ncbi:MAG TPA: MoaD/ThiS family protein, partial [Actinobacteria bacterium]|nr:MoaD/ThiS family protein [Actinomycetota bacterium]
MAHVRLFAGLRELAGTPVVDIPGSTVEEILVLATDRYGSDFRRGLANARIWVNGDPAEADRVVGPEDEVALLPPVSGGATLAPEVRVLAPFAAAIVLLGANAIDNPVWFVAALVGVAAAWAWDVSENGVASGSALQVPLLVAALAGAVIPYAWNVGRGGAAGIGLAILIAILTVMIQGVVVSATRDFASIAVALTAAVVVAAGTGSLVIARISTTSGQRWIWMFLLMVIAGRGAAAFLIGRASVSVLDPLSGSVVATIVTGVVGALIWDLNGFAAFLVAILVAVVLIVGAAFASLLSTKEVYFTQAVPGVLSDVG